VNILLLQNDLCINDMSADILNKYPRSSVFSTSGFNFPDRSPLLNDKWLIRLKLSRFTKSLKRQMSGAAKIKHISNFIFVCDRRSDCVLRLLGEYNFDFYILDNLYPNVDLLVDYVKIKLKLPEGLARYIVMKSNKYEPFVVKNVSFLFQIQHEKLNRANVGKYLQDMTVGFSYLYKYVLIREGDYRKVIKLVYRYQNSTDILCKFMVKKLRQDIALFNDILDGCLHIDNYMLYSEQKKISVDTAQQALKFFNRVTLEMLYVKLLLYEFLTGKGCVEFIMAI